MHIYYLETINTKEYDLLGTIYILKDELNIFETIYDNKSIFAHEPAELSDFIMEEYNIIAAGTLIKNWIKGRLYFSCCNISVIPEYRGKGYGKLLYMSLLRTIDHHACKLKTKPFLAQHSVVEDVPLTTDDANNIYNSLIRSGEITFHKKVLYGEGFSVKNDFWYMSDFNDNEFRGNIFKINKYPILHKFYVNKVFITQLGSEGLPPMEFRLWKFVPIIDHV
jgi:GNAT superfamily N-acetyltransferase